MRPRSLLLTAIALGLSLWVSAAFAAEALPQGVSWWLWPLALFCACFLMGVVAIPAGIGGGTLFVPIVAGFFPFHLDYVRAAGLLVALASAVAAGPALLRRQLADLRLALPFAFLASIGSIAGALIGLALPVWIMETALGLIILAIGLSMVRAKNSEYPVVSGVSALAARLQLHGVYYDTANGRQVAWQAHRVPAGGGLFLVSGLLGGMFGVGAGWANVPTFNLVMGVPLRVAAGTSSLVLSIASSAAAWVYITHGAVLALVAVPAVVGMMLGARVGAHLLHVLSASAIRRLVIVLLVFAGVRSILKGLGLWN